MRNLTLYGALLIASVALALVPVVLPNLDVATAALFLDAAGTTQSAPPLWVELVNEHVPAVSRAFVLLCLLGWVVCHFRKNLRRWAYPLAFVGLAVFVGPGVMTTVVKEYSLRARPFHVTQFGGDRQFSPALARADQCDDNCAFVSGHVACGYFLASLMLIDPRRRWRWIALGLASGSAIAYARISVGAHWLSDAIWALPVTLLGSLIVWALLQRVYPPPLPSAKATPTPLADA
jgi:lipid A 4'-phosphatase